MNGRNISTMNARQMLVNDKARTAYCYVPKAGCTTLKILFFKAQGAYAMCTIMYIPEYQKLYVVGKITHCVVLEPSNFPTKKVRGQRNWGGGGILIQQVL